MKIKHCKLSESKQLPLKKLFLANVSARKAAEIVKVNRNSSTLFFRKIKKIIANQMSKDKDKLYKEVEIDEIYYGKNKGSMGRKTRDKIILMGLKQRDGKVIIKKIDNASAQFLIFVIDENIAKNTTIYTNGWSF